METKRIGWRAIVFTLLLGSGCSKETSFETDGSPLAGTINLQFLNIVRTKPLVFGEIYTNDWNEPYTVDNFQFYVHDIKLVTDSGIVIPASNGYFLVSHEDTASTLISISAPEGIYGEIVFTLGVDSVDNISGAQTGALDPVNGMFWTWASGYVMAKLEGHSPISPYSGQAFTFHIGGFKAPYNAVRQVKLQAFTQGNLVVRNEIPVTAIVTADVDAWFSRINKIQIATTPAIHSPSQIATDISQNYSGMFKIIDIK